VAAVHAKLLVATRRQGRRRGAQDLIIAATAKATGREVVSADASA
jgi:tRNA(fMet)-specific endonuclease VapC